MEARVFANAIVSNVVRVSSIIIFPTNMQQTTTKMGEGRRRGKERWRGSKTESEREWGNSGAS